MPRSSRLPAFQRQHTEVYDRGAVAGSIYVPPPTGSALLLENGSYLLLEDGSYFLLDATGVSTPSAPSGDALRLEDGTSYLLLEDGSYFLLETGSPSSGGGSGGASGYTLRGVSMPAAPGPTSTGQPTQAGATYSSGTVTIDSKTITSPIIVSGTAVVNLINCRFTFGGSGFVQLYQTGGTINVTNCLFDGSAFNGSQDFWGILQIGGTGTVTSSFFYKCSNALRWESGTVQYNWIQGPSTVSGAHADGIEVYNQTGALLIDSNVIDIRDSVGQSGCINCVPYSDDSGYIGRVDGAVFSNNNLIGGSFPLYVNRQHTAGNNRSYCRNVVVQSNQWISQWQGDSTDYTGDYRLCGLFGQAAPIPANETNGDGIVSNYVTTWASNTFDGATIAKP